MAKYGITIRTDNAAFEDSPETEVARILRKLADDIEARGLDSYTLRDINGNRVGDAGYEWEARKSDDD